MKKTAVFKGLLLLLCLAFLAVPAGCLGGGSSSQSVGPLAANGQGQAQTAVLPPAEDWQAGESEVSALPHDEQIKLCGIAEYPVVLDGERENLLPDRALAASLNWANKSGVNWMTGVKNQGQYGTCAAFYLCGTMESVIKIKEGYASGAPDLSEWYLFYKSGGDLNKGISVDKVFSYMKNSGDVEETACPYSRIPKFSCTSTSLHKITAYQWLANNRDTIKQAIATYGPVAAVMDVYNDFFSYKSGVYTHKTGALAGGHGVIITGWDDAKGCWIAKNSWAAGWGESGYFRIAYGQCNIEKYVIYLTADTSPVIDEISPASGKAGSLVTVYGNFFGASQGKSVIKFNATACTKVSSWNPERIICTVPFGAASGKLTLRVNNATSNGLTYTVKAREAQEPENLEEEPAAPAEI